MLRREIFAVRQAWIREWHRLDQTKGIDLLELIDRRQTDRTRIVVDEIVVSHIIQKQQIRSDAQFISRLRRMVLPPSLHLSIAWRGCSIVSLRLLVLIVFLVSALLSCNDSSNVVTDPAISRYAPPQMVYFEPPDYPRLARAAGLEGDVTVEVNISSPGAVMRQQILETSECRSFDEPTLLSASRCVWEPARRFGRPVASRATYIVSFRLDSSVTAAIP